MHCRVVRTLICDTKFIFSNLKSFFFVCLFSDHSNYISLVFIKVECPVLTLNNVVTLRLTLETESKDHVFYSCVARPWVEHLPVFFFLHVWETGHGPQKIIKNTRFISAPRKTNKGRVLMGFTNLVLEAF